MSTIRDELRKLTSLAGPFEPFVLNETPVDPAALFLTWLRAAIAAGVKEPHAMTLSTVDADGFPDARVLILKDLDEHGWHFAITKDSPKGRHIARAPHVALSFYWPSFGRQVRIRGVAQDRGSEIGAADFLARPLGSRASALLARQSDILLRESDLDDGLAQQRRRLAAEPAMIAVNWIVYAVQPQEVEFWQGDEERRHRRLLYRRSGDAWERLRLWP